MVHKTPIKQRLPILPCLILTCRFNEVHENGALLDTAFCRKIQHSLLLLGNSRRFNYDDCIAAWAIEQTVNPQWITIEKAVKEYAIESEILLSATASKQVRIKCKDTKVLVNVMDVKQLRELKQWEDL